MISLAHKKYFKDVLGIQNWISPSMPEVLAENLHLQEFDGPMRIEKLKQNWQLVFLNLTSSPTNSCFEGESLDLFAKMKLAMKIENITQLVLEAKFETRDFVVPWLQKHFSKSVILILTDIPRASSHTKTFETWSASSLLQNSDRKKEAWATLQKVTQLLKAQ